MGARRTDDSGESGPLADRSWIDETSSAISHLAAEVEAVDLRSFEVVEPSAEMARLVMCVDELAARAVRITKTIVARFDQPEPEPKDGAFGPDEITAVRAVELGSIAFVAQLELRQCRERLAIRSGFDLLAVLDECDRTLRRILRALHALDDGLATELSQPRCLDDRDVLARSLRVRACYAELATQILRLPEADPGNVKRLLRLVGTTLAMLVGKPVYPELRVGDRLQLRGLQYRILNWLRGEGAPGTSSSGLQLWSDVIAFLGVLRQVNQRPELLDYDARVLERARGALRSAPQGARWPDELLASLTSLRGKDSGIDALLASTDPSLMEPWRDSLEVGSR